LTRLYTALKNVTPGPVASVDWEDPRARSFREAMDDDFGTPEAVAVLFDLASEVNKHRDPGLAAQLKALGGILGLLQRDPESFLQGGGGEGDLSPESIEALITERLSARKARDFKRSDAIRDELKAKGVVLEDGPQGTTWRRE
jgi:cysteinyl-tRNA synthetase